MPLFKRNEIYWIDLRHRGRRIRRSAETIDRKVAQRIHDELKAKLWKEKQTGRQLSDALLAWVHEKPRSQKRLNDVARIRDEYTDRPLIDVTAASLEEAMGNRSPGTYNRYMAIVRAAMNIARRKEWIESVPVFKRRQEPLPDDTTLTPEQWQRLRAELPEHLQDMADFAIATGLRWSNVAMLEWANVSMERRIVTVYASEAKGRKPIGIPLNDSAMAVLERVADINPVWVFTYDGRPIGSPKTAFNKARVRAGLPHITWHRLRHAWATWHAESGTPLPVLKELGGWSSIDIVMRRYAHLAPAHLAQYAGNVDTILATRPPKK